LNLATVAVLWSGRSTVAAFRTCFIAVSTLTLFAAPALAGPAPAPRIAPVQHHSSANGGGKTAKLEPPAHRREQKSVGSPTEGKLIGGSHLAEAPYLRVVPVYQAGDARWGIEPLVSMIDRAARTVRKQFPDAVLSVGHLSRQGGGEIDRHASHESGRDADIGFFIRSQTGKPLYADHFVAFRGDGTAASWPGAQFDDARNWALISAMVSDVHAHITHIFVATPIRARLLQYAEKVGAPLPIRVRASELMAQPKGSLPHDDHFHVRVQCPAGSDKCIEQPLARKHRPGHHDSGAAAIAHAQTPSQGQSQLGAGHGGKPHAAPHASPPGHGDPHRAQPPAPPAPASKPSTEARKESSDDDKSEAYVPSLAPMVPGLDSAVIPAPLAGVKPEPKAGEPPPASPSSPPATPPAAGPIDDPDGVLEKH